MASRRRTLLKVIILGDSGSVIRIFRPLLSSFFPFRQFLPAYLSTDFPRSRVGKTSLMNQYPAIRVAVD
jgi:hypothetical protein